MRIIYYSPHPTHDIVSEVGYATHQREVILALRSAGHEVIPVIMGGTELSNLNPKTSIEYRIPQYKKILKLLVPRFIWTSLNNYKLLKHDKKAEASLEAAILQQRPDLIYERSEYLQDSGARMALKYKLLYFLEVNAPFIEEMNEFEGYSVFHSLAHKKEAFKLKTAEKVFTVSSALSDFLVRRYNCRSEKIVMQPNCINPAKYHTDPSTIQELKKEFGSAENTLIGFVGSMFPYHGVDTLIQAFSAVLKSNDSVRLLIVGDGIVLPDLRTQAQKLGISDKVIFTGRIPHEKVFNYIAVMDICIMARSNWYGSPVKLFEYGLMNKPVIAPDTAPVTDVMENGKDALITGNSDQELAMAIQTLIRNKQYASDLASHFHTKVMENYTWDKAAKTILEQCI